MENFKREMIGKVDENLKIRVGRYNIHHTRRNRGVAKGKRKNKSGKDKEWTVSDLILCRGGRAFSDIKNNHRATIDRGRCLEHSNIGGE